MASTPEELDLKRREVEIAEKRFQAEQAQAKKEQDAASGPSAILASVLGMGASIGGAIPSLLKQPEQAALKRAQAGQGAGASLARQTASEAARRVVGASTAQPGAGRGGALREGLRAAEDITAQGAAQAAETGAREGLAATQMLQQGTLARRGAAMRFGAGVGQGLAGIGAMLAAAKDQGEVQPPPVQPALGDVAQGATEQRYGQMTQTDPATGLSTAPVSETDRTISAYQGAQGQLQRTAQGPYKQAIDRKSAAMQERGQLEAQGLRSEPTGTGATEAMAQANSPESRVKRHVEGAVKATAERQDAEKRYIASAGVPESIALPQGPLSPLSDMPPPVTDPGGEWTQEWIYQQAMNYDPRINQGMSPRAAEQLLLQLKFVPDLARLGIVDISGAFETPNKSKVYDGSR